MPAHFFSLVWPIVLTLIAAAALIVVSAGIATLVVAVVRLKQLAAGQAKVEADETLPSEALTGREYLFPWERDPAGVTETYTPDGIHYIPFN